MREITIVKYVHPDGHAVPLHVEVPNDIALLARDMMLSCEVLPDGNVALYARWQGEPVEVELIEIAENRPGERSPMAMLEKLVRRVFERKCVKELG